MLLGSHNRSREWAKLSGGVEPKVIRKLQLPGKNQLIRAYTVRWQRLCACMCVCVRADIWEQKQHFLPTFCIFSIYAFIQNVCAYGNEKRWSTFIPITLCMSSMTSITSKDSIYRNALHISSRYALRGSLYRITCKGTCLKHIVQWKDTKESIQSLLYKRWIFFSQKYPFISYKQLLQECCTLPWVSIRKG